MKKSFLFKISIFMLLILFSLKSSYASDIKIRDIKGTDYQVITVKKKKGHTFKGLKDKKTDKIVLLPKYHKISKIDLNNNLFFEAREKYGWSTLYSPLLFSEYIKKYFQVNEKIKFYNYPDEKFSIKMPTRPAVTAQYIIYSNNKIYRDPNYYYNCTFGNDEHSLIKTFLNVRYSCIGKVIFDEDVSVEDGIVKIRYNGHKYLYDYSKTITDKDYIALTLEDLKKSNSVKEIYKIINTNPYYTFLNYPKNAVIRYIDADSKPQIKIFEDGKVYNISGYNLKNSDYKMQINKVSQYLCPKELSFSISYQNPSAIIVYKERKYGIIDKYGNIKVPFIYDNIIPASNPVIEEYVASNEKLVYKVIKQKKYNNLFFVTEDEKLNKYKVINEKNEVLSEFEINISDEIKAIAEEMKYKSNPRIKEKILVAINPVSWFALFMWWLCFR